MFRHIKNAAEKLEERWTSEFKSNDFHESVDLVLAIGFCVRFLVFHVYILSK